MRTANALCFITETAAASRVLVSPASTVNAATTRGQLSMTTNELKSYGVRNATKHQSEADRYAEEISINGLAGLPGVLPESELGETGRRIDAVYAQQADEVGREESLRK